MTRPWAGLPAVLLAVRLLAGCGGPPAIPVDPAALADGHCAAAGLRDCTLLATGDGRYVLAVPGRRTRPVPGRRTRPVQVVPRPAAVAPSGGGVRLVISLPQQKLYAYRGQILLAMSRVSSGKAGHRTPTGTFRVMEKAVTHHSNRYSNAPMPYMQRLTSYGIAIHGGALPGYPASHGCIRVPHAFARRLYGLTRNGTVVTITSGRPAVTTWQSTRA